MASARNCRGHHGSDGGNDKPSVAAVLDEHMYLSRTGNHVLLCVYRWVCLIYITYVCLEQLTRIRSLHIYKFYTVWNWYLLLSYFFLAAGWSLQWLNRHQIRRPKREKWKDSRRHWTVVLLHVNLTTVFIVNTFTWLVLVPMMLSNPDTADKAKAMFFTFTSYNQHGVNSLLIMGDLMLNAIPFQGYTVGYAWLWSGLYSVWAHTYHALHGEWIYVFLDPTKANVIAMYCGIFASHWLFFGLVWGLFKLRDRVAPMAEVAIIPPPPFTTLQDGKAAVAHEAAPHIHTAELYSCGAHCG